MDGKSESIHPRAIFGTRGIKKNTCNPRSKAKLDRALAGISKHLDKHPRDAMSQARVAVLRRLIMETR